MANLGSLASLPAIVVVVEVAIFSSFAAAQLRPDYYASVCPNLEGIVRYSVKQSMVKSPISAPATLRLFFHDCAVMGCDASVMIISPTVDDKWRNYDDYSLKPEGFQTILDAKAAVDSDPQCRYKVSCPDIIALAARESVSQSGGPNYTVELGRYDGKISTRNSVMLPHVDDNLDSLNAFFYTLGLSQIDMIALSVLTKAVQGVDPSMHSMAKLAAAVVVQVAVISPFAAAQLRADYYAGVCPSLEAIVRSSVKQSMGCDASVMIISSTGDDENANDYTLKLEGFQTILDAKAAVDSDPQCRYKVSCADIIALATRESVSQSGGPNYTVELGRYDGRKSMDRSVRLPHPGDNLDNLNAFFSTLGLSQTDMIALSGGHTLGAADCGFFKYRIGGNDQSMNPSFDAQLQGTCAKQNFAFLDDVTPIGFDNFYYRNLQNGRGLLGSDQVLYTDERSRGTVDFYAANQGTFFSDFAVAMTKLGRVRVKTAADGEIRRDCRYPN
nr:peroxidase 45-like isoform X2 [Aegilops tauschii subsp. strangulata]